jgi:hypothetical protein
MMERGQLTKTVLQCFADGEWHCAREVLPQVDLPSHAAVNRFRQWHKKHNLPIDEQVSMGRRAIVLSRLYQLENTGHLETDGARSEDRSFRITELGKETLNGNGNTQG